MSTIDRLEAKGPRGEACIIVRTADDVHTSNVSEHSSRPRLASYRLASGERLTPTDDPKVFETLNDARKYTLR